MTKSPRRLLTVIAAPGDEVLAAASVDGLEKISDEEKLMVVDMDTQDVEDPITPEATPPSGRTSRAGPVHRPPPGRG